MVRLCTVSKISAVFAFTLFFYYFQQDKLELTLLNSVVFFLAKSLFIKNSKNIPSKRCDDVLFSTVFKHYSPQSIPILALIIMNYKTRGSLVGWLVG